MESHTVPARERSHRLVYARPSYWSRAVRSTVLYGITLLAVVTLVFALPRAMPGDPLSALEDPDNDFFISDPEARAKLLAYYGLDQPLTTQYLHYLTNLAHGDLGWSIARKTPVANLVRAHLPWTLLLMSLAIALASAISFVAGISAAWHRGLLRDRLVVTLLTFFRAIPEYALATSLLILFAVLIPVFPLYGARTLFTVHASLFGELVDVAQHLVLPVTALTLSLLGTKFLLVRNTVISSLGEDYMLLARAKGLPDYLLKYRHAGRNALLPFLTIIGIQAGFAVGGSIFIEAVFAYPGMGTLILRAVEARDYPVLEASFLVLAGFVLLANLSVDLLYARLDPRVEAE